MSQKIVRVFNLNKQYLTQRKEIESITSQILFDYEKKAQFINIIFVSNRKIISLNEKYLSKNSPTDVISFDYSNDKKFLEGEIYLCFDQIKENAKQYKQEISEEIKRVIIHGILHLVGENDNTKKETERIREKENYYLVMFHVKQITNVGTI